MSAPPPSKRLVGSKGLGYCALRALINVGLPGWGTLHELTQKLKRCDRASQFLLQIHHLAIPCFVEETEVVKVSSSLNEVQQKLKSREMNAFFRHSKAQSGAQPKKIKRSRILKVESRIHQ